VDVDRPIAAVVGEMQRALVSDAGLDAQRFVTEDGLRASGEDHVTEHQP